MAVARAEQRVRKPSEYTRIQQGGARVGTRHFVLILAAQALTPGPTRLGITASRKIGNAVARNRAKRLVREAFRATPELFAPGIDVVVIVRKPVGMARLAEIIDEWRQAAPALRRTMAGLLAAREEARKTGHGA